MDSDGILEELVAVLERQGVDIRRENLGGRGGGLCKFKDKQVFFLDTECDAYEMAGVCAQAVRANIDIENVYIKPEIRRFIELNG